MLDVQQLHELALELVVDPDQRRQWLGAGLLDGLATRDLNKALGLNTGLPGP